MKEQLEFEQKHGFSKPSEADSEAAETFGQKHVSESPEMFKGSDILNKIITRRSEGKTPFVLFSDIDGTFHHKERTQEMFDLKDGLEDADMGLALVTGRRDANTNLANIPTPDILIQAAGSEIYLRKGDRLVLDEGFSDEIKEGWDRESTVNALRAFCSNNERWREKIQIPEQDSKYEVISNFIGTDEETQDFIARFEKDLSDQGLKAKVTYWEHPSKQGFDCYIGILPIKAGKVQAIDYLHKKLGDIDGLVAGDSRIDIDMLLQSGFPAVIVGGSQSSLLNEAAVKSEQLLFEDIRELSSGQWVYVANQNKPELKGSGGIIAALKTGMFLKADIEADLKNIL